jgi:hypothetical protein
MREWDRIFAPVGQAFQPDSSVHSNVLFRNPANMIVRGQPRARLLARLPQSASKKHIAVSLERLTY